MSKNSIALGICLVGMHSALCTAQQIYKCINAQGAVAFQDHACAAGTTQSTVVVEDAPRALDTAPTDTLASPASSAPHPAASEPAAAPVVMPVAASVAALPTLWTCTRPEDGQTYMSTDSATPTRLVPLGILGIPPRSLASTYGARAATAAPQGKSPGSVHDSVTSGYTEVQDSCVPASPDQVCAYLRRELDTVDQKLRSAFNAERAILEPRQRILRDQLDAC